MKTFFNVIAIIMVLVWGIGYFVYDASNIIHILLLIALMAVLFGAGEAHVKRNDPL